MKFRLRTLLLVISVLAIVLPFAILFVRINRQPEMCMTRSGKLEEYALPHTNCLSVHDAPWGRTRIAVLHRITDTNYLNGNTFPSWLTDDGYLPIRINGKRVFAGDSTVVIYAENDSEPRIVTIDPEYVPLDDPWWPNADELWHIVSE